jgi:hypothetical protein
MLVCCIDSGEAWHVLNYTENLKNLYIRLILLSVTQCSGRRATTGQDRPSAPSGQLNPCTAFEMLLTVLPRAVVTVSLRPVDAACDDPAS